MSAPAATLSNFDNTTPAAQTGMQLGLWQGGTPFTESVTYNGIPITVLARNISVEMRNMGAVDPRTTTTEEISLASQGKLVTLDNASAVAVTLDSSVPATFLCFALNIGAGTVTMTPTGSPPAEINGAANLTLTAGSGCLLYFDGTNWWGILFDSGSAARKEIALAPSAPGNFTVAHGLGATPSYALIQMTSGGAIWFQSATRYDGTNLYLVASDAGITGYAEVFS